LERDHIPQGHLVKLSEKQGGSWMKFDKDIWIDLPSDYARALLIKCVLGDGAENKLVSEIYGTLERHYLDNRPWVENPHAIAFQNGTLYVHPDRVEFKPSHDPADRLRSLVPCHYDPTAVCPTWENFIRWALPDPSRLSLLQEAFGYTLIPGQPYQSFFMFTGTGSNGKSVVLSVLQALHKDSFETVALANLGSRFSLGTIGRKRLAIDTEAENVTHQVLGEGNSATAILKAWTGGDPVKIEAKKVQGWSETINAKYIMACNRRPRFADPTKGVWRRLKLLKFESHIEERQADRNLPQKLLAELPGIVNWAILGLVRLVRQNGFTQSDVLSTDLAEYQTDSDSVAQFIVEFLRPAPVDSKDAWFDLRPFHTAYKEYCGQMAVPPVGESEFRQRLGMHNVYIGRPGEQDPVMQCPAGFERMPGSQYWAVKGWRCYHPAYTTQTLIGSYVRTATPQFAQQGVR
jgi:P4 family phage/plasmid primase-like protien